MKELLIEEKAKAYDEAIERLRSIFYDNNSRMCEEYRNAVLKIIEPIFPELKESEDERTWIINYLSNRILNSTIIAEKENLKKAIAWLEKQGDIPAGAVLDSNKDGLIADTFNTKGEQKPWSEEDESMLFNVIHRIEQLDHYWNKPTDEKMIDWLKSLRPQNRWKPSDEQMDALSKAIAFVFDSNSDVKHSLESLYNELKKL